MSRILREFATTVLKEKMDGAGYKRIKNGWYKVIPDVILCIELQKLSFQAFRINFDIIPFACFCYHKEEMALKDMERAHWEKHKQEYTERFHLPSRPESPTFFFSPDSTTFSLRDPEKYPFYLSFWTDAVNEIAYPNLSAVHDLESACEVIGQVNRMLLHKWYIGSYLPEDAPLFVKLSRYEEGIQAFEPWLDGLRKGKKENTQNYIEETAEKWWMNWKQTGVGIVNREMWYWLMISNDTSRLNELVSANEALAHAWINSNKLDIQKVE